MAYENCLDYLRLRGIFPGTVAPFCPVDNLIPVSYTHLTLPTN